MKQQFTIQAITDCTIEYRGTVEYSIDNGKTWNVLKKLSIPAGHEAQFRNAKSKGNDSFKIKGKFNVYGHLSTLAPKGTEAFRWMFFQTDVVDASKLILDYDELWPLAYYCMFRDCTILKTAPELPATTLAVSCYAFMFKSCRSLATVPQLPATALTQYCFQNMLKHCPGLTIVHILAESKLEEECYRDMF